MGFLQAIYSLGEMESTKTKDSPLVDIINFLQLPYPMGDAEDQKSKVFAIRVWLEVTNPYEEILDIKGVANIDRIEYQAIGESEIKIKERCLYRDPVGSNVTWRFSPLYKLGKGSKNKVFKDLIGESGIWQIEDKCRFYKLRNNLLSDYEKSEYFTEGSTDRIMEDLYAKVDKIAELWVDSKKPCFLIFGIKVDEKFIYPGEITAFVNYFRNKINPSVSNAEKNTKTELYTYCALCGEERKNLKTLDKIFKFATFDKPSFLPGIRSDEKDGISIKEKVFPICDSCYEILSAGQEVMENRFSNSSVIPIPKMSMYVIPEIITDKKEYYRMASDFTKNFLINGIRHELVLFKNLSRGDEGLVYHFLIVENNQAQLIVHSLVEDVPPTRLKKLEGLWKETCTVFGYEIDINNKKGLLDTAISQIIAVLLSLAGKNEQDKYVMKEKIISVISGLLNDEPIGVEEIKKLIVSRLAGIITDPDWLKPKGRDDMPGRLKLRGMAEVLDFLYKVNRRDKLET